MNASRRSKAPAAPESKGKELTAKEVFSEHIKAKKGSEYTWDSIPLSANTKAFIEEKGFKYPTKCQALSIPPIMRGSDVVLTSETGSGKTLAFAIPIMERLLARRVAQRAYARASVGAAVCILEPTRELAAQVHSVFTALFKHSGSSPFIVSLVTGGKENPNLSCDVIVATPGRLLDVIKNSPSFANAFTDISLLVLDECDRMLEMGFREQIIGIADCCAHSYRQTVLASATETIKTDKDTDELEGIVKLVQQRPIRIEIDTVNTLPTTIHQFYSKVKEGAKEHADAILCTALAMMMEGSISGEESDFKNGKPEELKIIIFCLTKAECSRIRRLVEYAVFGIKRKVEGDDAKPISIMAEVMDEDKPSPVLMLHGDMPQGERNRSISKFKNNDKMPYKILVCTDVGARGLDIPNTTHVINVYTGSTADGTKVEFDQVRYVHRCGRCGRAGKEGVVFTIADHKAAKMLSKTGAERISIKPKLSPSEMDIIEAETDKAIELDRLDAEAEHTEMLLRRAENLTLHKKEIFSRPARQPIPKGPQKKKDRAAKRRTESEAVKSARAYARQMKRKQRQARGK